MSGKNKLRKDKTCLNCNYVVESRYCPNCGQENTDTRKTFLHLFVHFFEDLTHYENAFWKTIKNLLFKPAALTKEYLSGKRLSYLAPVRLYIFISFVTFFVITVFPDNEEDKIVAVKTDKKDKNGQNIISYDTISKEELKIQELIKEGSLSKKEGDSIQKYIQEVKKNKALEDKSSVNFGYTSIKQMDSIRKVNPGEINSLEYWLNKKTIPLNEKFTSEELKNKFLESFVHNFPKALFIYMPLFALVLWLFHNKKRWYYFDHGIFTLHYFSFLLLLTLIITLVDKLLHIFENTFTNMLSYIFSSVCFIWLLYYFYPAHHRFYGETRIISFIKSSAMFFINIFIIIIILLLFAIYTFVNIH
jgi:Protein of unknown function (DUF3667)